MDVLSVIKKVDQSNDTSLLCRGCLVTSGTMKSMTEWGLSEDFFKTTNIQVANSDGISELLCSSCEETLVKCCEWIKQCQESNAYLMGMAKKKHAINTDVPEDIRGLKHNTISCLLFENNLVVTILAPEMDKTILLPCPYQCKDKFVKKSDLLLHMIKVHNLGPTFAVDLQYYCSYAKCSYYLNSGQSKYFTGRKFLNQHYNKVHKEKIYCKTCELSFATNSDYSRHLKTCNFNYECQLCSISYKTNELLLVHLLRKHPALHKQYKNERAAKRKSAVGSLDAKKVKTEDKFDYACDSPKRSFATQTFDNIKNDVTLAWSDKNEAKRDEISTQTVFEDLMSFKCDEDSIFSAETVSLSDIQTQTPVEFGLSKSNKETITSETQSPDLSLKGTQTCLCLYDRVNGSLTSTETQTAAGQIEEAVFNSTETQTCFDEMRDL